MLRDLTLVVSRDHYHKYIRLKPQSFFKGSGYSRSGVFETSVLVGFVWLVRLVWFGLVQFSLVWFGFVLPTTVSHAKPHSIC